MIKKLLISIPFLLAPMMGHALTQRYVVATGTSTSTSITWDLLGTVVMSSNGTSALITGLAGSKYSEYVVLIDNLRPAVSTTGIVMQIATGSGLLAANYRYSVTFSSTTSTPYSSGSNSNTGWVLNSSGENMGNVGNQSVSYEVHIHNPANVLATKRANWTGMGLWTSGSYASVFGGGEVDTQSAIIDQIDFFFANGYYILTGNFKFYGIRNTTN